MIEMTIDSIRVSLMNYQRVVILKERISERYLPIFIGAAEADAIAVKLQGVDEPRPMTHSLLKSIIDVLGATVNSIIVSDLKNDTFYAKIVLDRDNKQLEVDSRTSDALALAVRTDVPIFADESVLDKAGISLESEIGESHLHGGVEISGKEPTINDEDMKKNMPAFYDFIDTLDLDDFDKHKS